LEELKKIYENSEFKLIKQGNRLSVIPVQKEIANDLLSILEKPN